MGKASARTTQTVIIEKVIRTVKVRNQGPDSSTTTSAVPQDNKGGVSVSGYTRVVNGKVQYVSGYSYTRS